MGVVLARAAVRREQLRALGRDAGPLPRVRRTGVERHDGIRRSALARAFALRRARRLRGGGTVRSLRRRSLGGRLARDRGLRGDGSDHRLSRLPPAHLGRSPVAAHDRVRGARANRVRPHRRVGRSGRTLLARRRARPHRSARVSRSARDVLLRDARARRRRPRRLHPAVAPARRLLLARHPRGRGRRAGGRNRHLLVEDARRRAQRRDDRRSQASSMPSITTASSPSRSSASRDRSRSSWAR